MAQPTSTRLGFKIIEFGLLGAIAVTAAAGPASLGLAKAVQTQAQSPAIPQWQVDAGGRMAFDVLSVKQSTIPASSPRVLSNISLGPMEVFTPTGGLFSAKNGALIDYLIFAYRILPAEVPSILSQLPQWAITSRYDIQARASGNPTKDQFRLMIQALLAEHFKLAAHFERRKFRVLALVQDKRGRLGPQLQSDEGCTSDSITGPRTLLAAKSAPRVPSLLCHTTWLSSTISPSHVLFAGRGISMERMAYFLEVNFKDVDRPLLDHTGLPGNFEFSLEVSEASRKEFTGSQVAVQTK